MDVLIIDPSDEDTLRYAAPEHETSMAYRDADVVVVREGDHRTQARVIKGELTASQISQLEVRWMDESKNKPEAEEVVDGEAEEDDLVPKFLLIARAVAEWPDTTCCEVKISCYEEPDEEDIERCKTNIKSMFEDNIVDGDGKPIEATRISVVVVPYCANDEPDAPAYDPAEDEDDWDDD